jgi:SAM-dependent methyltransferase
LPDAAGLLLVAEHDFTKDPPPGEFDLVINCRAFQGLPAESMRAAAANFHAALRPGGVCIVDTMNVQGALRNVIEDSLIAAGFYVPFQKPDRWYRQELDGTGIVYRLILERPRIPCERQYPKDKFNEFAARDQRILDSFEVEYENRCRAQEPEVRAKMEDPVTIVAHIV